MNLGCMHYVLEVLEILAGELTDCHSTHAFLLGFHQCRALTPFVVVHSTLI